MYRWKVWQWSRSTDSREETSSDLHVSPGVCGPALHSAAASEDPLSAERFRLGVRHSATSSSSSDNRNRAAIMATAVLTEFVVCFAPSNGFLLYQCLYRHWKQWVGCLFGLPVGCVFWELKCFSGPSALVRRLVSVQTADPHIRCTVKQINSLNKEQISL